MTHKQVLIWRKDLNCRKGKIAAQCAHASLAVVLNLLKTEQGLEDPRAKPWLTGKFKKICVYVNSEEELLAIHEKTKELGILTALIQDSGLTEFGGVPTYTAVAVGPDTEEKVNEVTGKLPLL